MTETDLNRRIVAEVTGTALLLAAVLDPAVTIADASQARLPRYEVPGCVSAQIGGALVGVWPRAEVP